MVRRNLGLPHRLISKNFNCVIWVKGKIFRNKLKNIEEQSKGVLQFCHRSYLVNGDYVTEILKEGHKQYLVLNTEDKKIPLSKSYIDKFSSKSL